jgi:hypothetical protein
MGLFSIFGNGLSASDRVVERLKQRRSLMFRNGLIDPLQVIKLLGLHDKFLNSVAEDERPADEVAA